LESAEKLPQLLMPNLNLGNGFLNMTSGAPKMKGKIETLEFDQN